MPSGLVIRIARDSGIAEVAYSLGCEVNPGKGASLPFQKSCMLFELRRPISVGKAGTASGGEFGWEKSPGAYVPVSD